MKTVTVMTVLCGLFAINVIAQEKFKFGDVSPDILSMSVYEPDTSAVAVVLYKNCEIFYDSDFNLNTQVTVRYKMLKPAGFDYANFYIPFYTPGRNTENEIVSGISGFVYNSRDGKTEKIKLTKDCIFEENTTDNYKRIKIAFPNVNVGSVYELKYTIVSPYYGYIEDYFLQSSVPVVYSRYSVVVPEYITFSKQTLGYEIIEYKENPKNLAFLFRGGGMHRCNGTEMIFTAKNLPGLKDDGLVWNKNDFMAKVVFDLRGVRFPDTFYKSLSEKWEDIDKLLRENDNFGRQFKFGNLLRDELKSLIKPEMSDEEKISAIYDLAKNKIKWNEKKTLYSKNVKNALKDGVGSSAEINALLICLLRDADFDAYPVVMSLRSNGRIMVSHPTSKKLNYFIVGVDSKNKSYYMDASSKYGSVNVLPTDCMVINARAVKDNNAGWVDLHNVGRNTELYVVTSNFNDEGILTGSLQKSYAGVPRIGFCVDFNRDEDYKKRFESKNNVIVSEIEVTGQTGSESSAQENIKFESDDIRLGDEFIYISPFIFDDDISLFKEETRKLPVEFPYPVDKNYTSMIFIPDGYQIDDMPKSERIKYGDNDDIQFNYIVEWKDDILRTNRRIIVKRTVYTAQEYKNLREFWSHITDKNESKIVLKRIEK